MSHVVPADKHTCELSRTTRGWSSFKEWGRFNRKWAKDFRGTGRTAKDKIRNRALADALDDEYERLIRHNL